MKGNTYLVGGSGTLGGCMCSAIHHMHSFPSTLQYLAYHGQHLGAPPTMQQRLYGYLHPKSPLHSSAWDDVPESEFTSLARSCARSLRSMAGREGSLPSTARRGEAAAQAAKRRVKVIVMRLVFISIVAISRSESG